MDSDIVLNEEGLDESGSRRRHFSPVEADATRREYGSQYNSKRVKP